MHINEAASVARLIRWTVGAQYAAHRGSHLGELKTKCGQCEREVVAANGVIWVDVEVAMHWTAWCLNCDPRSHPHIIRPQFEKAMLDIARALGVSEGSIEKWAMLNQFNQQLKMKFGGLLNAAELHGFRIEA